MGRKAGGGLYQWFLKALQEHHSDGCLLWPFGCDSDGYGALTVNWKATRAHRLAFKHVHGRWPKPCCLHTCDTPACFNPRHLFEGTTADNTADMVRKGRGACGERTGGAVLTATQVREIRKKYKFREIGCPQLATAYGVHPHTIYWIVTKRNWKHI